MAYDYTLAGNLTKIKEQEYGTAKEIWLTKMDSCIAVVARKGDDVTGVHLVRQSKTETWFDNDAAKGCADLLPAGYDNVALVGVNDEWKEDDHVKGGYAHLVSLLNNPEIKQYGGDVYGYKVENSKIQLGFKDEDGDIEWNNL